MERIREAVQRAREERGTPAIVLGNAPRGTSTADGEHVDSPRTISYMRTRSCTVSSETLKESRIVTALEPGPFTDAFKMLSTQVSQALRQHHWNTLAVTSPGEHEGKTLVATNLAICLAMEFHQTALLVDADLRAPTVRRYFALGDGPGLCDYLAGDMALEDLLIEPGIGRFVVLPGGAPTAGSREMLASRKMGELVRELKRRYATRIVVFDVPPVLVAADALAFAPYVEATLLVVEEGKTSRADVARSAELLRATNLIGTVLNKSDEFTQKPVNGRH